MLNMHVVNVIVRIHSVRHTRQRTFATLALQGTYDSTLRLPFMIRMVLTKQLAHTTARPQHRHQHWSVRDTPPLLNGNFLKVNNDIEQGVYYNVRIIPNCTKSGISLYSYYVLDAIKLEECPETCAHSIDFVPDAVVLPQYPYLQQCTGWYDNMKRFTECYTPPTPPTTPNEHVCDCHLKNHKQFLNDFGLYLSQLYCDTPNVVERPKRGTRRQGKRKRFHDKSTQV